MRLQHAEAKNHPVNGFSAPRAGGGTAPVPAGIPQGTPTKDGHLVMSVFCLCNQSVEGFEGCGGRLRRAVVIMVGFAFLNRMCLEYRFPGDIIKYV